MVDVLSIVFIFAYSTILCWIEIPVLHKKKENRELVVFSILLGMGTLLAVMKALDWNIPNPSDFILWMFSPAKDVIQSLLK